jgi:hypothetical protein
MAATNLNTVRGTIESRLKTELDSSPAIPIAFHNMPYTPTPGSSWVQCLTSFGQNEYLTLGGTSDSSNLINGVVSFNIFTAIGVGPSENLVICKRIRDLYNRVNVSGVYFDPVDGPNIVQSSPEGYFQSRMTVTFEVIEDL